MDCGLTQKALAERAGISCRYLIAIKNEERIPKPPALYRLIHSMHISADRIFYPEQPSEGSERSQLAHMLESCSLWGSGSSPVLCLSLFRDLALTQQEAIEHIYSMSDEDIRMLIGFIERIKAGGNAHVP